MAKKPRRPQGKPPEAGATKAARAHHYVPEFYLAGFTLSGGREDSLWVLDREKDRSWQTRPANIAHQRDFYRVDIEDVEPDAVEKALGQFEGQAAEVLRKIGETRELPEGEDFSLLINFVALQATRVPQFRQMYESNMIHLTKWRTQMALSHPTFFDRFLEDMRREGKEIPEDMTREGMLEFLEDESNYTIEIPREASVQTMAEMAGHLVPFLGQRSWSLVVAKDDQDDFICSDRPVILAPTKPNPPPFLGFGLRNTEVAMPINRQVGLVGDYENEPQVLEADRGMVGFFNHRTLVYSERFVYSARDSFPITELKAPGPAAI